VKNEPNLCEPFLRELGDNSDKFGEHGVHHGEHFSAEKCSDA